MRDLKLRNISLILVAVALIAIAALCLAAPAGLAQGVTVTPRAGPTAYLPGAVEIRNVSTPTPGTAAVPVPSVTVAPVASATPVPRVTVTPAPAVTMVPTVTTTPVPVVTVTPAPAAQAAPQAQLVNYGTSSDTFKRGERASGFVTIKNNGNTPINDVTASVSANAKLPVVGAAKVGSKDYTFSSLNIQPGETKRVEFAVDIPSEFKGVSTAGDYDLHVTMKTGGQDIGSFTKTVKVT